MGRRHWKSLVHRLGIVTENSLDFVLAKAQKKLQPEVPLHLIAYRGYGVRLTEGWQGSLRGRVLRYNKPALPGTSELWNNLKASYARFHTDELPGVRVRGRVAQLEVDAITDEEGYFLLEFDSPCKLEDDTVSAITVALSLPGFSELMLNGDPIIELPLPNTRFGVISDIDDTLLVTNATSLRHMMRLTLLESPATRLAFNGVAAFYQALHAGCNPFFYVSSSPWNLYEFLTDFMHLNHIVPGPLLLRDFGIDEHKFIAGSHDDHKLANIRRIFNRYPSLTFILIGDSGQHDPDIYAAVSEEFPGRIKAIYIRNVSEHHRDQSIRMLSEKLQTQSVHMMLVPDTVTAAAHAAEQGFIDSNALADINQAVQPTTPTAQSPTH